MNYKEKSKKNFIQVLSMKEKEITFMNMITTGWGGRNIHNKFHIKLKQVSQYSRNEQTFKLSTTDNKKITCLLR